MNSLLDGTQHLGAQLERELTPDPIFAPAAGSFALHVVLFGSLLFYGILSGLLHHNLWGNPGTGGAIQVSLVNALPLPAEQQNDNVLTTQNPSKAPAEPTPKAKQAVDETAIPIAGKQEKSNKQPTPKNKQPQPKQNNLAQFGEQAGSFMPRAAMAQNTASNGPVSISNGDF
ncbi:MAG TPA: hypothetical protein VKG86_09810, partial [Terracidiphilus sp.]|nr:hypothetical protein [Terracidiphilus sp.]